MVRVKCHKYNQCDFEPWAITVSNFFTLPKSVTNDYSQQSIYKISHKISNYYILYNYIKYFILVCILKSQEGLDLTMPQC